MDDGRSGPLGCGCALLPGMVLGVIVFVLAGLLLSPSPTPAALASGTEAGQVSVSLSEEYLGRLVSASLGGGPLAGMEVDAHRGNELTVHGRATVTVLGREIGLPLSFGVRVSVSDGRLRLVLIDSSLPAGSETSEAMGAVDPLLVRLSVNLQRELERALGRGWAIEGIETEDDRVVLLLRAEDDR